MVTLPHFRAKSAVIYIGVFFVTLVVLSIAFLLHASQTSNTQAQKKQITSLEQQLEDSKQRISVLEHEDQRVINAKNSQEIADIQKTYGQAMKTYEALVELGTTNKQYTKLSETLAKALGQLGEKNYASAQATLTALSKDIEAQKQPVVATTVSTQNVPQNNTPPTSGYSKQTVKTSVGDYVVDIVSGDLSSTRVIVDTASSSDCANDCPVLALGDYVARNGAFAGINGSYFCPASYPSCAGKTNSFDTLLMNKDKHYFNSDNNVYSTVPAVIFSNGSVRFVGRSLEWGRDTGIDSMIANQPMLVSGGHSVFGGDDEVKRAGKGSRSFVANRGNTVYIGVVHNASASEMAKVLETMGMENALNLDSGGSTALWSGGYKVGPGRNIPNAILFVRK